MQLKRLSVQNVRVHKKYTLELEDTVTLIVGPNGSGKTSLLEAIYIALRGKSFKGVDEAIRRSGEEWYRIDLDTDRGKRTVKHQLVGTKKTFEIEEKVHQRLTDRFKHPVVLFEPDDLRIVSGSPTRRRDYLDTFIAQYSPQYTTILHRYERALLQRNKLLKRPQHTKDELFAWNVALSRYGADIIAARQELIALINELTTTTYRTISPTDDTVEVRYSHHAPTSPQHLLAELEQSYERDRMLGTTSIGPHRHDMVVSFNQSLASDIGSRGELRTITLALKFIEAAIIAKKTGERPIILLDDVFSELDHTRQQRLLSEFHDYQVVMTSTEPTRILSSHIVSL